MTAFATGWLHMGSPPRTVIRHKGRVPEGIRHIVFEVTLDDVRAASGSPLAALLTGPPHKRSQLLEKEARWILQQHAKTLPYPAAALVIPGETAADGAPEETDFLTICTVLSKSNDHVYLRDKEPNLGRIRYGRRIALVLPSPEPGRWS